MHTRPQYRVNQSGWNFCVWPVLALLLSMAGASTTLQASYIMNQIGSGSITTSGTTAGDNVFFASAITLNRSATGYGDTSPNHPEVIEGVYYTYSFTVPGNLNNEADFDAQIQMGGLWSGWGDPGNGIWQNGPTSSSWNRGIRYQHRYPGETATTQPATSYVPPTSTIAVPSVGDVLSVSVLLLGLTNDIQFIYSNLTTGESFTYTYLFSADPSSAVPTGNLTFDRITFRTDSGPITMDYTYGTLHIVPEPTRALLLMLGICGALMHRRRQG